ncbi:MAG: hypothetical protein A2Y10_12250 [Planctomycetes bacterium GWF2_41_51]|nr:MAG: hypothetical protein A2Y10_12250 [Planctomycetes bacterium GWF2_41_51]HBG28716.1 hypothetical protein [Phycisphaerales bacterium]
MDLRRNILFITLLCILASANADTFTNKKTGEQFDGYAIKIANRTRLTVRNAASENVRHIEPADYDVIYNEKGRRKQVYVIDINDALMLECETAAFEKAVKIAENQGNLAIVIRIDTPGGRVDLMKRYCSSISGVGLTPVIAVVGGGKNGGAYSAGAIIAMGCDKLYMETNSAIGAATLLVMDANDGLKSAKGKYGDDVGEKLDSAHRAYCASVAEQAGRSGIIAQAMIDRQIEVIAVKDANNKYKICDGRDLQNKTNENILIVNRSGSLLTLSAKTAADIGFADGQIDNFNLWKQDCEFAGCRWIPSQEIKTSRRQYSLYEKRFNAAVKEIQQLDLKISIAISKNEEARYVFQQRELTNQKILEVRTSLNKMIGQFKTVISLKKSCADLPVELNEVQSQLSQLTSIQEELTNMLR